MVKIGLTFDTELVKKYKDINSSCKENNSNMCSICFCEFEEDGEDPDDRADALECGHQFNVTCWKQYLKDKVKTEGSVCTNTKCP